MNKLLSFSIILSLLILFKPQTGFAQGISESAFPTGPIYAVFGQTEGTIKLSLANQWSTANFTALKGGLVHFLYVKAGNWGNSERAITCKVVNKNGFYLSVSKKSNSFTSATKAEWRLMDFRNNPFNLVKGENYKILCKGPDTWNSIYWIFRDLNNSDNSKTYIFNLAR